MRGRNGSFHYYYYCRNHDPLRAGGENRRCPERNIRANELDTFVFEQVRTTMLDPDVLLAGKSAISIRRKDTDDELLAAQLVKFDRQIESATSEQRRVADLYQAGFIEHKELLRRGKELQRRKNTLEGHREELITQRQQLTQQNRLRDCIHGFADDVCAAIDQLDFEQQQKLLRLVIDEVRVKGTQVEINLLIPLGHRTDSSGDKLSTKDGLRSFGGDERRKLSPQPKPHPSNQTGLSKLDHVGPQAPPMGYVDKRPVAQFYAAQVAEICSAIDKRSNV